MSKKTNKRLLQAIGQLAALFEDGELQAETDPTEFVYRVCREIMALRGVKGAGDASDREWPRPCFERIGDGWILCGEGDEEGGYYYCSDACEKAGEKKRLSRQKLSGDPEKGPSPSGQETMVQEDKASPGVTESKGEWTCTCPREPLYDFPRGWDPDCKLHGANE